MKYFHWGRPGKGELFLCFAFVVILYSAWVKRHMTPEELEVQTMKDFTLKAEEPCRTAIEHQLSYKYTWQDGFTKRMFTSYRKRNTNKILIIFYGNALEAQNGFGAMLPAHYECEYNFSTNQVEKVNIGSGSRP